MGCGCSIKKAPKRRTAKRATSLRGLAGTKRTTKAKACPKVRVGRPKTCRVVCKSVAKRAKKA